MDVLFQNFGLQNAGRHEGQNNDEYAEGDAVLVARGNICRDESFGKAKEHTSDDCTIHIAVATGNGTGEALLPNQDSHSGIDAVNWPQQTADRARKS